MTCSLDLFPEHVTTGQSFRISETDHLEGCSAWDLAWRTGERAERGRILLELHASGLSMQMESKYALLSD